MSEVVAENKFHCPACGGEAIWTAGKQALVCPFCGTESPATLEASGEIKEHPLATALRQNTGRGWEQTQTSVKCQSCQAISVMDATRVAQRCDFCGSASIVPYNEIKSPIRPESLLPIKITETQVRDSMRKWYGTRWFAPSKLKDSALTDTVKGIYLPYWTFDAQVRGDWTAESGTYYYTTETYRDSNGKTQTRQVRHVRWWPSSGTESRFFDDHLVPASRGVHPVLLRKVEPFPTKELVPYEPGYLAGWVVEQYQIDLIAAAQAGKQVMQSEMERLCASKVPGDTHRNLDVETHFSAETFKHVLLPVWLLTFNYGSKSYQAVINGVSGQIAGEHPLSFWKIFFAVVAGLIVAAVIYAVSR